MRLSALFMLFTFVLTSGLSPVDQIRKIIVTIEAQQWTKINNEIWRTSGKADIEVAKEFVKLDKEINRLPLSTVPALNTHWWEMPQKQIEHIDKIYYTFLNFMKREAEPGAVPSRVKEWLSMAATVLTDPKTSVFQSMFLLRQPLVWTTILQNVLQEQTQYYNRSRLCELQISTSQVIYDMYTTIALAEIKGFAITQFSWMLLKIYRPGNITDEAAQTRKLYRMGANKTAEITRNALSQAKRELYRCDPLQHQQGKTYDEVTRLIQGYIENEVDMNSDNTCRENCDYYKVASNHGCFKDQFCSQQTKCRGTITDCVFVESAMTVCTSSFRSHRRYEWIQYKSGHLLGQKSNCRQSAGHSTNEVQSWWRWLFWHCSYCMCLCDDATHSDRYFSLREVTSDIENNKVVTGIRLVKHGSMFYLQISEGTLNPNGIVTSGSWVAVQKFSPIDHGITLNKDYHALDIGKRAIDFDDLVAPDDRVLTGVRFQMLGAHLNLAIRATKFSFENGRLFSKNSMWFNNDNTDGVNNGNKPRSRIVLYSRNLPTRSKNVHSVTSVHDQFLEFTHSDFDSDVAQSTVPFIDVQPLQPYNRGAMLSGAGVAHRGAPGSGGFIALKLFTYDYSKHVQAEIPTKHY